MLVSNALIGLREGLEAALVVVILVAFLVKTDRRWALKYVWLGVGAAVALSAALGAVLTFGTRQLSFEQQELIGGLTSILAVAFVTVMVFWMKAAARSISGELKGRLERALDLGPMAIAFVGFLGVGREGLETAIFFYATTQAAGAGNVLPMLGWAIGLGGAAVLGWLIYRGALQINLAKFFRWTGAFLVIVAAGILAYGIHDLQEAGFLPGLDSLAFDVSRIIDPGSWYAALLKGFFNFTPATTWLQLVAWVGYVGIVMPAFLHTPKRPGPTVPASAASHTPGVDESATRPIRRHPSERRTSMLRQRLALTTALLALPALTACTGAASPKTGDDGPIAVAMTDTECSVGRTQAPAGTVTFTVTNQGSKINEFYVYAAGDRIVGEVENIGPGLTRTFHVEVSEPGSYETACKPGMVGSGIRGPFTITGSNAAPKAADAKMAEASAAYGRYVGQQADLLLERTTEFVAAVKARDVEKAKALYPLARTPWERIEPVAESFGDLDPKIDGREDVVQDGMTFTGYHRLEKDLWVDGLQADSSAVADQLLTDVTTIVTQAKKLSFNGLQLANGALALLDEMATGKITGEEERYSHTDMWDFAANWEGSKQAIAALRPVLQERDAALLADYDARAAELDRLLDAEVVGDGYRLYNDIPQERIRALSSALDAVSEQVAKFAGVVAGK